MNRTVMPGPTRQSDSAELRAMGYRLLAMAEDILKVERVGGQNSGSHASFCELASEASGLYAARRIRGNYFDDRLLGEPAWDILLDLFLAAAEGRERQSKSVCIASAVPPTTALRWINVLSEHGLIEKRAGLEDQRCTFLRLSHKGQHAMVKTIGRIATQRRANMIGHSAFSFSSKAHDELVQKE